MIPMTMTVPVVIFMVFLAVALIVGGLNEEH